MTTKVISASVMHPDKSTLERELQSGKSATVHWTQWPTLNVTTGASIAGCSTSKIYALAAAGKVDLVRIAGRTCVRTDGIIRLIQEAEPWVSSGRSRAAITERARRTAARITKASSSAH